MGKVERKPPQHSHRHHRPAKEPPRVHKLKARVDSEGKLVTTRGDLVLPALAPAAEQGETEAKTAGVLHTTSFRAAVQGRRRSPAFSIRLGPTSDGDHAILAAAKGALPPAGPPAPTLLQTLLLANCAPGVSATAAATTTPAAPPPPLHPTSESVDPRPPSDLSMRSPGASSVEPMADSPVAMAPSPEATSSGLRRNFASFDLSNPAAVAARQDEMEAVRRQFKKFGVEE